MAPGSPPPGPAKMPTERNRSLASNPKTKQNKTQGAGSEGRKKKKKARAVSNANFPKVAPLAGLRREGDEEGGANGVGGSGR